ncbi:uncharacterized protein LOC135844575 isoform X2 [Planococcus citri]
MIAICVSQYFSTWSTRVDVRESQCHCFGLLKVILNMNQSSFVEIYQRGKKRALFPATTSPILLIKSPLYFYSNTCQHSLFTAKQLCSWMRLFGSRMLRPEADHSYL